MNLIAALGQALDFLWKAAHEYANTPEGQKELNDVILALENADSTPAEPGNSAQDETTTSRYRR